MECYGYFSRNSSKAVFNLLFGSGRGSLMRTECSVEMRRQIFDDPFDMNSEQIYEYWLTLLGSMSKYVAIHLRPKLTDISCHVFSCSHVQLTS